MEEDLSKCWTCAQSRRLRLNSLSSHNLDLLKLTIKTHMTTYFGVIFFSPSQSVTKLFLPVFTFFLFDNLSTYSHLFVWSVVECGGLFLRSRHCVAVCNISIVILLFERIRGVVFFTLLAVCANSRRALFSVWAGRGCMDG